MLCPPVGSREFSLFPFLFLLHRSEWPNPGHAWLRSSRFLENDRYLQQATKTGFPGWNSLTRLQKLQRLFDSDFVIFQLLDFFLKISLTTKSFYPLTSIIKCDWVNRLILVCWFSLPAQFDWNFFTFSLLSSICRRLSLYQVGNFTTIYQISCIT